jgi:hypothetical protein
MAKSTSRKGIPKRYSRAKRSFLDRISADVSPLGSKIFCAFPTGISFNGQDEGEDIILVFRQHPAVLIPKFLITAALFFVSLFSAPTLALMGVDAGPGLTIGTSLVFFLLGVTFAADTYLKWFFCVNIITSDRIVDVDFSSILFHRFSEAQLENIEDVSHSPVGVFSSIFDYGDVYVQTAGERPEFEFKGVPRPRDIQDTLFDLMEMKQNGKI